MSRKPSTPDSDLESHAAAPHPLLRTLHLADGARTALTAVGLLAGLSILGVSADALAAYRDTHLPAEFHLPLWPEDFNAGPTVALVVCSTIIVVSNGASLALCRGKDVSWLSHHLARPSLTPTPGPRQSLLPPPNAPGPAPRLPDRRPRRDILLLRRQRLGHHRHAPQLELPVAERGHGVAA